MDPRLTKQYAIEVPTRSRAKGPLTCAEANCKRYYETGTTIRVDESTQLGQRQAEYLRHGSGRRFREQRLATGLTEFFFFVGQRCFTVHLPEEQIAGERYIVKLDEPKLHSRPIDWVEDMSEHLQGVADLRQRG